MTAVKTMLELGLDGDELKNLSDSQLKELKKRLLRQLEDLTKGEGNENNNSDKQN